ncbi:Hpt domain-containing protein, partial [Rhizobium ruizarguesonis]
MAAQMAAFNIVFEAPYNAKGPCPSKVRPIDLVHLAKQTMCDKTLEIEVLQMFARQPRQSFRMKFSASIT